MAFIKRQHTSAPLCSKPCTGSGCMRLFRGRGTQRARSGDAGGRQRTMRYGPAGAVAALWLRPCRGAMHAGARDHMAHHLYLIGLPLCLRSLSPLSSQGPQP
eukprot:scaffold7963_cov116-Isochrysis_galbana.AAC.15